MKFILIILLVLVLLFLEFGVFAAMVAWLVLKWLVIISFCAGFALGYMPTGDVSYGLLGGMGVAGSMLVCLMKQD